MNALTGWAKWLTWLLRIVTGGTFVVSGFVKAIDPWGTLYKLQDYMAAMHLPDYPNLLLVAAFLLFGYEFCIGIFLILGCFRRSAPICAALIMGVMLPLTLWIAVWNPVADCGCFGDAIKISNWGTFWKNVILTLEVVWLLIYNRRLRWIIRPHLQWIALIASAIYVVWIGLCGYIYQPLIDFRQYPVGSRLVSEEEYSAADTGDEEIMLVYERDGVEHKFSIDDELPPEEEGWRFVRRETTGDAATSGGTDDAAANAAAGSQGNDSGSDSDEGSTFRLWSDDGEEDLTDDALLQEGGELLLLMPDLAKVSVSTTWQINSLYTWARDHGIEMIGVVSGTPEEIADWRDLSLAAYPLYTAEDTEIKMVARGNPAVVYLADGRVVWKSSLRAVGIEDFMSADASADPADYARNDKAILYNSTALYAIVMAVLAFLSYITVLGKFWFRPSSRKKTGEAEMTNVANEADVTNVTNDEQRNKPDNGRSGQS